jgi:hypothetical protein
MATPAQEIFEVHFPPDTTFSVTSTMLQHDSPSMLSRAFLSDNTFIENQSHRMVITDKSPDLFTFILDYLRGYTIFPLKESAIPPRWLPLHKTYENLRRDAAYYGFLRLEAECKKWLRRLLNPSDKQAVLKLDFAPFVAAVNPHPAIAPHPLTAEMMLECHLADVSLLRRRFLKPGAKTLTYGPMPWKQIFEQIRNPSDRDGVLQLDGSAMVEIAPLYLKQPRATDDTTDDRKVEWAKLHVSKAITTLILDGVRPAGMHNNITIRFHGTEVTTTMSFQTFQGTPFQMYPHVLQGSTLVGTARLTFNDKLQRDGYVALRTIARAEIQADTRKEKEENILIPLDRDNKTVVEVDESEMQWETLCNWARRSETLHNQQRSEAIMESVMSPDVSYCEKLFRSGMVKGDDGLWNPTVFPVLFG